MNCIYVFEGLVHVEMPLSSDPVLGPWKIRVKLADSEQTETFKVDKYGKLSFKHYLKHVPWYSCLLLYSINI